MKASTATNSARTSKSKSGYIAGLDGWRAIAILGVFFAHDRERHFGHLSDQRVHDIGGAGVNLFFAISGLLICSRLIEEEKLHGSISLRGFYIRRFFRIFPAAWVFLAVATILGMVHQIPYSFPAALAGFFMIANYYAAATGDPPADVYTDHFWSLSVEEHFYLILPAILVFVRRRVLVLSILATASLAWYLTFLHLHPHFANLGASGTDLQLHALMIPALLAILLSVPANRAFAARWLRPWFWITASAILLSQLTNAGPSPKMALVGLCFPLMVASTILHPESMACRFLELKPLRYVGRISYGLYLWQQIFVIYRDTSHWPMVALQHAPFKFICPVICTLISYYFLEKPMISLGHRLAPPATPGRPDVDQVPSGATVQPASGALHSPPVQPEGVV